MSSINLDLHSNRHIKNVFWTNCIVAALYPASLFTPILAVLYFFKIGLYYKYKDLMAFYTNDLKEYKIKPVFEEVIAPDPEMEYLKSIGVTFPEDVVEEEEQEVDEYEELEALESAAIEVAPVDNTSENIEDQPTEPEQQEVINTEEVLMNS